MCYLEILIIYIDVIMDMLGNAKMREAILRYYQDSGDPKAVFRAIRASQDLEEDLTDSHAGMFYNAFFGKKGWVYWCVDIDIYVLQRISHFHVLLISYA